MVIVCSPVLPHGNTINSTVDCSSSKISQDISSKTNCANDWPSFSIDCNVGTHTRNKFPDVDIVRGEVIGSPFSSVTDTENLGNTSLRNCCTPAASSL